MAQVSPRASAPIVLIQTKEQLGNVQSTLRATSVFAALLGTSQLWALQDCAASSLTTVSSIFPSSSVWKRPLSFPHLLPASADRGAPYVSGEQINNLMNRPIISSRIKLHTNGAPSGGWCHADVFYRCGALLDDEGNVRIHTRFLMTSATTIVIIIITLIIKRNEISRQRRR